MKKIRISNRSFERTAKRFLKVANKRIDTFYDDYSVKEKFDHSTKYHINIMVQNLIKKYKQRPFKNYSAFVHKITVFTLVDTFISDIKVSYTFEDDLLKFKLFTKKRNTMRYRRKSQFTLKTK